MRDQSSSSTAAWSAAYRSLGRALPKSARLVDDPYGARFVSPSAARLIAWVERHPALLAPLLPFVLFMQVRTHAIDRIVLEFVRTGGGQILLLGAGFDSRAHRLPLGATRVFEVDHPATQAKKRAVLSSERVAYVPWNFERDPVRELPSRLAAQGHEPARPTLTIWEGVTEYLREEANSASVEAIRALSSEGSVLAMTYLDRRRIENPGPRERIGGRIVQSVREPFRFGWRPNDLPAWLAMRGFALRSDRSTDDLAHELLPPEHARKVRRLRWHLAVAIAA